MIISPYAPQPQNRSRRSQTAVRCITSALSVWLLAWCLPLAAATATALPPHLRAKVAADFVATLEQAAQPLDLLVQFEHTMIRASALKQRIAKGLLHDDAEIVAGKKPALHDLSLLEW